MKRFSKMMALGSVAALALVGCSTGTDSGGGDEAQGATTYTEDQIMDALQNLKDSEELSGAQLVTGTQVREQAAQNSAPSMQFSTEPEVCQNYMDPAEGIKKLDDFEIGMLVLPAEGAQGAGNIIMITSAKDQENADTQQANEQKLFTDCASFTLTTQGISLDAKVEQLEEQTNAEKSTSARISFSGQNSPEQKQVSVAGYQGRTAIMGMGPETSADDSKTAELAEYINKVLAELEK